MDQVASLQQLIRRGEDQHLEFKSAVPTPEHLARLVAAFANSGGGTILLGVGEDGSIPGVLGSEAARSLRSAIALLTPKPEALITELRGPGTGLVVRIDVAEEPTGPVVAPDGLFQRSGSRIQALPAETFRERAVTLSGSELRSMVTHLATTLESLTERMLGLERQIVAAQSWKRRLPDILLGAGISAVLGFLVFRLLG